MNIYFAGVLFDHKALVGNKLLARAIEKVSQERYHFFLPQEFPFPDDSAVKIRNNDLKMLIKADMILLNFDGLELDSGTVVEYVCSKMLDIPALLLRTDSRIVHEDVKASLPWNLMCAGFPRSRVMLYNAMSNFAKYDDNYEAFYNNLAEKTVEELDSLKKEPSLFCGKSNLLQHYRTVLSLLGSDIDADFSAEELDEIVSNKINNGIYGE